MDTRSAKPSELTVWQQWDIQEARRIAKLEAQAAYIELNNTYLAIERGIAHLTIHSANQMRCLVTRAYEKDDPMQDYWAGEFQKLPDWNIV